jgi:hypothetical protein
LGGGVVWAGVYRKSTQCYYKRGAVVWKRILATCNSDINHSGDSNPDEECHSTALVGYTQEAVRSYTSVTLQVGFS